MIFGLTGGIACGKSTITKTFIDNNIPMVDADVAARKVVEYGTLGNDMLFSYFGKEYFNSDRSLNRIKLGALVFNDKSAMKVLNAIMGPLIDNWVLCELNELIRSNPIVGYDAALIIENGNADKYRPLIVVNCPPEEQISRLMKRNNLTYHEARVRIDAQMPLEKKLKYADYVIDTSGTIENSQKQTLEIIEKLNNASL